MLSRVRQLLLAFPIYQSKQLRAARTDNTGVFCHAIIPIPQAYIHPLCLRTEPASCKCRSISPYSITTNSNLSTPYIRLRSQLTAALHLKIGISNENRPFLRMGISEKKLHFSTTPHIKIQSQNNFCPIP